MCFTVLAHFDAASELQKERLLGEVSSHSEFVKQPTHMGPSRMQGDEDSVAGKQIQDF